VGFPYGTLSGTVAESLEETPRESVMSKVFSALAVSVDGYITGRDPGPDRGLGDGGKLFDWYFDGDVPSRVFDSFRLSEPSARFFDAVAGRVGASIAGRNTYEDSNLGAGRRYFHSLPEHIQLRLVETVPAPGVTHLHYEVIR
jgi:hypothetical protein